MERRMMAALRFRLTLVSAIVASLFVSVHSVSDCTCPTIIDSTKHHLNFRNKQVEFISSPEVTQEEYVRQQEASPLHTRRKGLFGSNNDELSPLCDAAQIHVGFGYETGSVIFSFVTTNFNITTDSIVYVSTNAEILGQSFAELDTNANVLQSKGSSVVFSEEVYIHSFVYNPPMGAPMQTAKQIADLENTADFAYDHKTGAHWAYWVNVTKPQTPDNFVAYNNPYAYYDSPYIHTTKLSGLSTGVTYYYRVSGSCVIYHFTLPKPHSYPLLLALSGDIGQTQVSEMTITAMDALNPDFALIVGDLSYADGMVKFWDSFGTLIEPFAAQTPTLTTAGNHEVMYGENSVSYKYRWPTPYEGSGSAHFCYWGREVGVVHVIALCSYAGFQEGSLQYTWLKRYLETKIDRERTPWVLVMVHAPFYNSNNGHWMEGELQRVAMEPLLYAYGVDIVLSGHVHSYERTNPVYDNQLDECGITYLNLGDGGNYESSYGNWRNDDDTGLLPPAWSAFREGSFGVGGLEFLDATTANYSWHRHACSSDDAAAYHMNFSSSCATYGDSSTQKMMTSDSFLIVRPSKKSCPNKYISTVPDNNDDDDVISDTEIALIALSAGVGILTIILVALGVKLYLAYGTYASFPETTKAAVTAARSAVDEGTLKYKLLDNMVVNDQQDAEN